MDNNEQFNQSILKRTLATIESERNILHYYHEAMSICEQIIRYSNNNNNAIDNAIICILAMSLASSVEYVCAFAKCTTAVGSNANNISEIINIFIFDTSNLKEENAKTIDYMNELSACPVKNNLDNYVCIINKIKKSIFKTIDLLQEIEPKIKNVENDMKDNLKFLKQHNVKANIEVKIRTTE